MNSMYQYRQINNNTRLLMHLHVHVHTCPRAYAHVCVRVHWQWLSTTKLYAHKQPGMRFFLMTSSYQLPSSLSSLHPLFTLLYISSTLSPSPAFNYHSSVIMLLHLVSICLLISFLAFSSSHSPSSSLVAPWGNEALRTWQRRHHAAQRDSSAQITTQKWAIWCYFVFSLSTCHWGWYVV